MNERSIIYELQKHALNCQVNENCHFNKHPDVTMLPEDAEHVVAFQQVCMADDSQFICHLGICSASWGANPHLRQPRRQRAGSTQRKSCKM